MQAQSQTPANPGLEGVVAAETRLSHVDGERGELIVAGLKLEQLAERSFEDVVALLWRAAGSAAPPRVAAIPLPAATVALLRDAARRHVDAMDALRMGVGTLTAADDGEAARLLVGSFPRKQGMERKDLLMKNAQIFQKQGRALAAKAAKDVRILVVGNPCNTNCLIAYRNGRDIPANQ